MYKEKKIHHLSKKIYQYTPDFEYIDEFNSVSDASKKTGINQTNIARSSRSDKRTSGGWFWSYFELDDYGKELDY